jgi:alkylation response protein AidB-like acyl-CoA dehydrogenase
MIDLLPSADQQAVADEATRLLGSLIDFTNSKELTEESLYSPDLVRRCAEQGWFALALGEAEGGVGLSVAEEVLVFREAGRHLAPLSLIASALSARVASLAGAPAVRDAFVDGSEVPCFGQVGPDGEQVTLIGLSHGSGRSWVLVLCRDRRSVLLARVEPSGLNRLRSIDPLVTLSRTDAVPEPEDGLVLTGHDAAAVVNHGRMLLAAYQSGVAEAVRDMSAAYARQRVQFGSPIGAFQAVKHRCADMAVRAEAAWCQTAFAATTYGIDGFDPQFEAAAAKYNASVAAIGNTRDNIQNHGAIGYTSEHPAHLFLGRAHVADRLFGDLRAELDDLVPECRVAGSEAVSHR